MNIGQLRKAIAAYLNPDYVINTSAHPGETGPDSKFQVGEIDLLLLALNNVKREAEQLRDFQLSKCDVDVAVDGFTGGVLDSALLHGTNIPVKVKSIIDGGWRTSTNGLIPVDVVPRDTWFQEQRRIDGMDGRVRYKGDPPGPNDVSSRHQIALLTNGNALSIGPGQSTAGTVYNIELSVFRWMSEYEKDTDEDFFTAFCHNYMMWAGIVEANHLVKQFVPRQEGNLSPPDKLKERAWSAVEKWDDFIEETGRISRL